MNQEPRNLPTLASYQARNVSLVELRRNQDLYPRLHSYTPEAAIQKMVPIVWAACLYRNQEMSDERLKFIAQTLYYELMLEPRWDMRQLTFNEIGIAIRAAVMGERGEFYTISVASLYRAVLDYARNEGHEADKRATQRI